MPEKFLSAAQVSDTWQKFLAARKLLTLGKHLFNTVRKIREGELVKAIGDYLREWPNQSMNKK